MVRAILDDMSSRVIRLQTVFVETYRNTGRNVKLVYMVPLEFDALATDLQIPASNNRQFHLNGVLIKSSKHQGRGFTLYGENPIDFLGQFEFLPISDTPKVDAKPYRSLDRRTVRARSKWRRIKRSNKPRHRSGELH